MASHDKIDLHHWQAALIPRRLGCHACRSVITSALSSVPELDAQTTTWKTLRYRITDPKDISVLSNHGEVSAFGRQTLDEANTIRSTH